MTDSIIEVFTDGACRAIPGPGGWGALLRRGTDEKEIQRRRTPRPSTTVWSCSQQSKRYAR
jgi:ribonuclease HI